MHLGAVQEKIGGAVEVPTARHVRAHDLNHRDRAEFLGGQVRWSPVGQGSSEAGEGLASGERARPVRDDDLAAEIEAGVRVDSFPGRLDAMADVHHGRREVQRVAEDLNKEIATEGEADAGDLEPGVGRIEGDGANGVVLSVRAVVSRGRHLHCGEPARDVRGGAVESG